MATPKESRHNSRFRVAHCGAKIPPKIFGSSGLLYSFSKNSFFFDCLGHKRKRLRAQSSHFQIYSHTCTSIPYMSPRTRNKMESLFTILYTTFHQSGNVIIRQSGGGTTSAPTHRPHPTQKLPEENRQSRIRRVRMHHRRADSRARPDTMWLGRRRKSEGI